MQNYVKPPPENDIPSWVYPLHLIKNVSKSLDVIIN